MKKVAQFRRSNGPNAGFSEKLAWQLSKGPATGRELAQQLGMTLSEFNRLVIHIMRRGGETLQVEPSNQVCLGGGSIDRTYTLVRNPRRVAPPPCKPMVINYSNDRCQCCKVKRGEATTTPPRSEWDRGGAVWGSRDDNGVWGWICHACYEAKEADKRSEALARIVPDEDYDEWDFYHADSAKCPWCSAEICTDESYDADDESHECDECGHSYSLTAEHSVSWTTKRVEGE
ncbi:hypothetical protein [Pantoea sp. PNT01]|uniref:hypothetical protein n=1 Tax=Pantoea sp. PNT01 TaxID=2769271 RepID=UPI001CE13FFD|nr:hypothetical protein [Pantoea sp. PNT01]